MDLTTVDRPKFEGDASTVPTIKMGDVGRPYLRSVVIHLENQGGSDSNKLSSRMLEAVNGSIDSMEHITAFYAQIPLYGTLDTLKYRTFSIRLRGLA